MKDWNVVVSVYENCYAQGQELLEQLGSVGRTEFFNILAMKVADIGKCMEQLQDMTIKDPLSTACISRFVPVLCTFTFQSPSEFEEKARLTVCNWIPSLQGKTFYVRMHRRGFKGKLSSMDEEHFLDDYLLKSLELAGTPGRISFHDPDAVIIVETIGPRAGISYWTRAELQHYSLLRID